MSVFDTLSDRGIVPVVALGDPAPAVPVSNLTGWLASPRVVAVGGISITKREAITAQDRVRINTNVGEAVARVAERRAG